MARLTTWNSLAEDTAAELENLTYPVVSFTAVRVGDYDGELNTIEPFRSQELKRRVVLEKCIVL